MLRIAPLLVVCLFTPLVANAQEIAHSTNSTNALLEITIPPRFGLNPSTRISGATYEWRTFPGAEAPDSVRWALVSLEPFPWSFDDFEQNIQATFATLSWSPWAAYDPPSAGTSWTSPITNYGNYEFLIQSKDSEGNLDVDFTLDRNMRRVQVGAITSGPLLSVSGPYVDFVQTNVTSTPPVMLELTAGAPIPLCWSASADAYGMVVTGYRYGWDITDFDDDSQWEIQFTPFVGNSACSGVTLPPASQHAGKVSNPELLASPSGLHTFYVEAIDYDGHRSRQPVEIMFWPPESQVHSWSRRSGDAAAQFCADLALDAGGNVFATGYFAGTMSLGGRNLTSAGGEDIYIAKYNSFGTHVWSKRVGDSNTIQEARSVATDAAGDVFVCGNFSGTLNFGGANLAGTTDFFLAKLDGDGNHLWSKAFNGTGSQFAKSLACDAAGNSVIVGSFGSGSVSLGGSLLTPTSVIGGFGSDGTHMWSKSLGPGNCNVFDVAFDNAGQVLIAGQFLGSVNFGAGTEVTSSFEAFLLCLGAADGSYHWLKRSGDFGGVATIAAVTTFNSQSIVLGNFTGSVNLGGGVLTGLGSNNLFLARFDPTGAHMWSRAVDGNAFGNSIACYHNEITVTGSFGGALDFGGNNMTSASGSVFLARLHGDGSHIRSQQFGNAAQTTGRSVVAGLAGEFVGGEFQNSIDFGNGVLTSAGVRDIFIAHPWTETPSGIRDTPVSAQLHLRCFPNPFNPNTTIEYDVPRNGRSTLAIYDVRGARVRDLPVAPGRHSVVWDGRNRLGAAVGSGVYFVRLANGATVRSLKVVLLK